MAAREHVEPVHLRGLVAELAEQWTDDAVEFVRDFVNLVYRLPGPPPSYLRITSETHRSPAEIASELAIVRHVGAMGVAASQPAVSRRGELIHTARTNELTYSACVFTEAPGVAFAESPPADAKAFFRAAGRAMGLLHVALSSFEPPSGFVRHRWTDDRWARFAEHVPETETAAWELFTELGAWTGRLSTDPSSFGLIHGDLTIANMRIDGSRIALFDFDACCEHWRAYEIATFLHYFGGGSAAARELAYENVLDGYASACPVSAPLLAQIPLFGKMRLLYSFLVFAEEWGCDNPEPEKQAYLNLRRRLFRAPPAWPAPAA